MHAARILRALAALAGLAAAFPLPAQAPPASTRMQRRLLPAPGALPGPETPGDPFAIPGLQRETRPVAFNTLREVFLDPGSGKAVFLGTYDPAYATGPIDYDGLLADALRAPYPAFSLDPAPSSKASRDLLLSKVDQDMARVQRDLAYGKAWMLRIGDMLLSDPALPQDRQRFVKKGTEAMGTTPDHVRAFWDLASGRTKGLSAEGVAMTAALFTKMGTPEVGQALLDMQAGNAAEGLDRLGLGQLLADLRQRIQAGQISKEAASTLMQAAFWEQVMVRLKVPGNTWRPWVDAAKAGRGSVSDFLPVVEGQLTNAITDRVMLPWLDGLVLSQAFLERFYQVPPVEVAPRYSGGLTPDGELARTFYAADWSLKLLAISPEMAERIPGHLTYQNYEFRLATARGVYAPGSQGLIRTWLSPRALELRHDPTGRVVTFGAAQVTIRSELMSFDGGARSAQSLEREAADGYAAEVTRRYDEYARALPELHRLREAAKVIALVRWAKARNLALASPAPPPPNPLPASFRQGFWTATFQANPSKILFVLSAHGGVDFDSRAGDAWVQPQAQPGLADTALKQLVGSAALAQQAAGAALGGDLEAARDLAQRSELAMIGDVRAGFPPLAQVPVVPEPTALAAFQSQALSQSREAIEALKQAQSPAQRAPIEARLKELKELMAQGQQQPASAPQLLARLQTGGLGTLNPPAPSPAVTAHPAPVPAAPGQAAPRPPVPVQAGGRGAAPRPAVPPEERARMLNEIEGLRGELCRLQAQLRRFNATIQMDQGQRAQWEAVTNAAYDHALDQVKEAISDELKDLSMELPKGYLEEKLAKASSPEERERIMHSLRLVQHLKESYDLKDFSAWASYEDYSREEILEGAKMVAELTGLDEWIKNKLVKKYGLGRVLAFGEAAQDLVAASYDVTSEVLAWKRLNQLNRNSESYLRAVEASGRRMQALMEGIREREQRLGLPPGATKGPCP